MARDLIHYHVRRALEKEGWKITADPYKILIKGATLEIDLGVEKVLEAKKDGEKMFVEIKTFNQKSILYAFYGALGQYICYRDGLAEKNITHPLYLAMPLHAFKKMEKNPFILRRIKQHHVKIIVINSISEKILKWIK